MNARFVLAVALLALTACGGGSNGSNAAVSPMDAGGKDSTAPVLDSGGNPGTDSGGGAPDAGGAKDSGTANEAGPTEAGGGCTVCKLDTSTLDNCCLQ